MFATKSGESTSTAKDSQASDTEGKGPLDEEEDDEEPEVIELRPNKPGFNFDFFDGTEDKGPPSLFLSLSPS